jgi:hypothetical protein
MRFSEWAWDQLAMACPYGPVVVMLATELRVALVAPEDQELLHKYSTDAMNRAAEGLDRTHMIEDVDHLESLLAGLMVYLRQRDRIYRLREAPQHLPGEPCAMDEWGGCGCQRDDCDGYTCNRRDPLDCDCYRHPEPVAEGQHPAKTGQKSITTFGEAWPTYLRAGWPTFPLKPGTKFPPMKGVTGWDGIDLSAPDMAEIADLKRYKGTTQTGVRMPIGVVGLDFDGYDGRTGLLTKAEAERRWGALPPGPMTTSRDDGSGIRLFRIPADLVMVAQLEVPEMKIGHVEIIQRHHRYAVVAPSIHPKTGQPYQWLGATGVVMSTPPRPDELPWLPDAWCEALKDTGAARGGQRASQQEVEEFLTGLPANRACGTVRKALRDAEADLVSPIVSRHDDMTRHVLRLMRLGEQGHPGVPPVLDILRNLFVQTVTADESRITKTAIAEFGRMLSNARGVGLLKESPTPQLAQGCRFCDLPPDPGRTKRSLVGAAKKVLSSTEDNKPKMLRWFARVTYSAVQEGSLPSEVAAKLVVSTAVEAGLGEGVGRRLVAAALLRLEKTR